MVYKMVLTFSFLISTILGSNLTNLPSFLHKVVPSHPQEELKTQQLDNWIDLKFNNLPDLIFQSRDDEDLYGSWDMYEMYDYPDSSYTDGTSLEDMINDFGLALRYNFYVDNTILMESSIFGQYNSITGDWWSLEDSLFISYINPEYYEEESIEVRYELFDYDEETTGLSFFLMEVDDYGDYSFGEIRFYPTGTNDGENEENCGDMDACNYNPDSDYNPYEDNDCWYPEDEGWCDCEGNIPDCSGECGGGDLDSCTTMYSSTIGFYENSDCTGELMSELAGMCFYASDNYYPTFYFTEEDCLADGGMWLDTESCYTNSYEFIPMQECTDNGGIIFDEEEECTFDDYISEEDCQAQGGYFDYYDQCNVYDQDACNTLGGTWDSMAFCVFFNEVPAESEDECLDNYEDFGGFWLEGNISEGGPPDLYFYDDGSFSEACYDEECQFVEVPSQEECENAGGEYESWGDCVFEMMPSEEECESVYGYYDEYENECYVWYEEDCNTLNGTWESEVECDLEDEDSCLTLNGYWADGICPVGNYTTDGNSLILTFFEGEGPIEDEIVTELEVDESGNWESIVWNNQDFYYSGECLATIWTSTPPDLAITNSGVSLPVELAIDNVYPNPFNPKTEIHYTLPTTENVTVSVFDITGKKVVDLISELQNAGEHSIVWNAEQMSSGVYFIRLQTDDKIKSQHVILLK